jgi:long-chain acyl-CoA synthetase
MTLTAPVERSLEHWAAVQPDTVAVVAGDRILTYGQWNDQADRLADALSQHGLGPGDRIGMRFRLDLPWFVLQRALQKIGVAQVAVNWKLTPPEAEYILRDSDARGLACDDADPSAWADYDVGVLLTAGHGADGPGFRIEDLVAEGEPVARFGAPGSSLVLYTSGTTGRPKGVPPRDPTTHPDPARLQRYMASVGGVPPYPDHAQVLLTLPVHHGLGPGVVAHTTRVGGTVVLLDPFDAESAVRLIDEHRVECWYAVPTMLLRIKALPDGVLDRYDLSSLSAIGTAGAPVPQSLKEWIIERIGPDVLWEMYGASEAGMLTYITPADHLAKPGSSGRPYDEVEVAIIDDQWNRLPAGATGEIAVNTPSVLTGYLGRDPLGDDTVRDGFYRTGDVGHVDDDGYLFITDRVKDMIVAGGVNIYPAEIEVAILDHPDVESCAVIGIPHDDFGEQPMAFVVPRPGRTLTPDEVLSFLDGRLAGYKKPRRIEVLDALPTSPMGKVLKTELRQPFWEGRERNV